MDSVIKMLNAVKGMTGLQMVRVMGFTAFMIWAATEGREVWQEFNEYSQTDEIKTTQALQTDLLVSQITENKAREDKQDQLIEQTSQTFAEINTTQQLMQQRFEMEINALKEDVNELESEIP